MFPLDNHGMLYEFYTRVSVLSSSLSSHNLRKGQRNCINVFEIKIRSPWVFTKLLNFYLPNNCAFIKNNKNTHKNILKIFNNFHFITKRECKTRFKWQIYITLKQMMNANVLTKPAVAVLYTLAS